MRVYCSRSFISHNSFLGGCSTLILHSQIWHVRHVITIHMKPSALYCVLCILVLSPFLYTFPQLLVENMCKDILLLQPSSAAAEHILLNSFSDRQELALKDYIEASMILQDQRKQLPHAMAFKFFACHS